MITEILQPSIKNSSIRILDVHDADITWKGSFHIHSECEINYILKSGMTYILQDKEYTLNSGDIFFVNSNVPHNSIVYKGAKNLLIQFRIDTRSQNVYKSLSRYINNAGLHAAHFKSGTEECKALTVCLENIIRESQAKDNAYEDFLIAEIYKIIAYLYRFDIIKSPESFFSPEGINKIMPVLEYIHNHYNENISLDQMSALINVNKSHFCRLFKKNVNTSFVDYLNFVRISKAENLLLTTEKSISEIGELTGFGSSAYFTKIFKRLKSCTPMQYRKYKNQ